MRKFTYVGKNFWGDDVYKFNNQYAVLVDGILFWCTPLNNPDGEPGFHVKQPYDLQKKPTICVKGKEEKKFILAGMIAANQFNSMRSVEWLDFASGIHDLSLTKMLLMELQETPMPMLFVPGKGWCGKKQAQAMKNLKKWKLDSDDLDFRISMISRIYYDCECYLQNHYELMLWAKNVNDQVAILQNLYNSLYNWEKETCMPEDRIEKMCREMIQTKSKLIRLCS